jgi:16S rRNA (guanine527-N7)-methyltransferase
LELKAYAALVEKWSQRINLVAPGDLPRLWTRHIVDSAQLLSLAPNATGLWLDLGSGAGFPGLVIALFARDSRRPLRVELVESDLRKCAFLQTAANALSLDVAIHSQRIESLPPKCADVVSARALAPLAVLLEYAKTHRKADGIGLFPKGASVHKELEAAGQKWQFDYRLHRSITSEPARIVEIGAFARV